MMKTNPCASFKLFFCASLLILVSSCESPKKEEVKNPPQNTKEEEIVYLAKPSEITPPPTLDFVPDAPAPAAIQSVQRAELKMVKQSELAPPPPPNTENYQHKDESPIKVTAKEPVSTFSIDVDTGAYSNVRRFLKQGQLPPKDAVRIEELINYFPYANTTKKAEHPFGVQTEVAPAPWNPEHQLLRVRIQAMDAQATALPPSNLVFLVDVSGSMNSPDKLPLVKNTLKMLTKKLRAQDRISLVVYAGRTQVELEPTPGNEHDKILAAIDKLEAAGSTAGESAMKLAYQMVRRSYIPNGINRILMATDGDFNVGLSNIDQLKDMVAAERKTGISLTSLGFGQGNYNEYLMEQLADIGNGNYAYIDSADEGRKVLIEEMASTFNTVAGDVKVQIEFNPAQIAEYRLIGYENRILNEEDFNNDKVDAGEIGAGKTVTAIYELTPVGKATLIDPHRYEKPAADAKTAKTNELGFLRIRYKKPGEEKSILLQEPLLTSNSKTSIDQTSADFRFAASVAGFGLSLRDSKYLGDYNMDKLIGLAKSGLGEDEGGYRAEFVRLMKTAQELSLQKPAAKAE
jgi:Ca-activated chloride channel family protein